MNTNQSERDALLLLLARIAPCIAVETIWTHDPDAKWDFDDPNMDEDDYEAWQSEVKATIISQGQLVSGSAYLGGTWEKFGDFPWKTNPDISGYFPQMLDEALEELARYSDEAKLLIVKFNEARDVQTISQPT